MKSCNVSASLCFVLVLALAGGCSSNLAPTQFSNPSFDFGFVQRLAVLPFDNHTADRDAGVRATRLMATELLSTGAVDVVETGEVLAAIEQIPRLRAPGNTVPSKSEVVELGNILQAQALMLGSVTQSETLRSGRVGIPVVTIDAHLVETETGVSVWAATHTEKAQSLGKKLLGTGATPISETTRRCIQELISTLID